MRQTVSLGLLSALVLLQAAAFSQEHERPLCDPADPKNKCPGDNCVCINDTLEVVFGGDLTVSIYEYDAFTAGAGVDATVVMDTKDAKIQGWSYGIQHDGASLKIESVTIAGTEAAPALSGGFNATSADNVEGGGFISAVVLSFTQPTDLPIKRNPICLAHYTLLSDVGTAGTLILISDQLNKKGSPKTDINITISGKSRKPLKLIDGLVRKKSGGSPENCTNGVDDDGDKLVDCADPDCALDPACPQPKCLDYAYYFGSTATTNALDVGAQTSFAISSRNKAPLLGFQLGVKSTTAGPATTWELSGLLGSDADRLVDLIMTDDQGGSQTPQTPNKATSAASLVGAIDRGAALGGFTAKDFFAVDLSPGVGGPGFTVGYVADMNPAGAGNKIAATADGSPCPLNELLKVKLGVASVKFSRGDVDGNGHINVTDAILIIQIKVGNLAARFACDEALDANDDGAVTITDAIPILMYVFQKGPNLAAPFRICGTDPTNDNLTCTQSNCQ